MPYEDQFTAVGPSNTGSGVSRVAFSDITQSGSAPQDFIGGVNVQGYAYGVYGECLPAGSGPNLPTDRTPPLATGVMGRGDERGVIGQGILAGVVGTAIDSPNPNLPPNTSLVGCVGGEKNIDGSNNAMTGVQGSGFFYGVVGLAAGTDSNSFTDSDLNTGVLDSSDGVLGVSTGSKTGVGVHGIGLGGARGGVFESFGDSTLPNAQVSLVPASEGSPLPTQGVPGDLFTRLEGFRLPPVKRGAPTVENTEPTLYFCVRSGTTTAPAQWRQVQLSTKLFPGGS